MRAKRILGIDPGLTGALAFLGPEGVLEEVEDMPVVAKAVNPHLLARLIQGYGPIRTAVVERAQSMPKQGIAGAFNYGTGYGMILGVLATLEIPVVHLNAGEWKRKARLTKDKGLSRKRAMEMWPDQADLFALAKHDGRAEACLMAAVWLLDNPERRRVIQRYASPGTL